MRKKQKSKAVMYRYVKRWQASGMSQSKFCRAEKLTKSTFRYWVTKYKQEKNASAISDIKESQAFIPVKLPKSVNGIASESGQIEIYFPNGVQLNCSAGIDIGQLKYLINI
jgi:hypothetical protein